MTIDNIDRLIEHTDHPVIERYLIAFVGYPDDLESASRDDILHKTLKLDIDLNIRLRRMSTEFFDEEGELIATPDDWKAQELLGFESTYPCVTLEQIIADIDDYERTPNKHYGLGLPTSASGVAVPDQCTTPRFTARVVTTATGSIHSPALPRESGFFHVGRRQMCKDILQPSDGAGMANTYRQSADVS